MEGSLAEWERGERNGSRGNQPECLKRRLAPIPQCGSHVDTLKGAKILLTVSAAGSPLESFCRLGVRTSMALSEPFCDIVSIDGGSAQVEEFSTTGLGDGIYGSYCLRAADLLRLPPQSTLSWH